MVQLRYGYHVYILADNQFTNNSLFVNPDEKIIEKKTGNQVKGHWGGFEKLQWEV